LISGNNEKDVRERVQQKVKTFLNNIDKDLDKVNNLTFETLKKRFSSKYKNLPAKFHYYLDEIIKRKIQ
jgi:hemerythrin-like domain-containing protein